SVLGGTLGFSTPATASSNVGSYAITPSGLTATNYMLTFVNGTLAVMPAPLTVTGTNASRLYGAANPNLTGTLAGVQNGDAITANFSTATTPASAAGTYAITPTLSDPGRKLSNYTVTSKNGTLTVNPAPLSVIADDTSRAYGQASPVFTVHGNGFVLGQDLSVLGGTLNFSTPATASSPVGKYALIPSGLTAKNYAISFVKGTLTITSAPLT